jgi:hypothetical protein
VHVAAAPIHPGTFNPGAIGDWIHSVGCVFAALATIAEAVRRFAAITIAEPAPVNRHWSRMAYLDTAPIPPAIALDPNRNDAVGLALSAVLPLAGVMILGGYGQSLGLPRLEVWPELPLAMPDWAGALVILMLFPLIGVARWAAAQEGERGRRASWWAVGLIGWLLVYPVAASGLDPFFVGWLDLATLLIAVAATARIGAVSAAALLWMLPVVGVLGLVAVQGYVFLTNGWSPGFAVTAMLADSER